MGVYFTDATMLNIERDNARKAILNIKKPFCVSDLFIYMEQIGFSNRRMILQLLDELFEDGLIDYVRVDKPTAEFAFIVGDVADRPQANHKDGDKTNNCADNLEWITKSENMNHAYRTGLQRTTRNGKVRSVVCLNDGKFFGTISETSE